MEAIKASSEMMRRLLKCGPALVMFTPATFHWLRAQFVLRVLSDSVGAAAAMESATIALSAAIAAWITLDLIMMRWLPNWAFGRRGWVRAVWSFFDPVIRAGMMTTLTFGEAGVLRTGDTALLGLEVFFLVVNLPIVVWLRRAARLHP